MDNEITTTDFSKQFDVKPPTVTEIIQKLDSKGLLTHERYNGISLTERGVEKAKDLLRKHRILEALLVDYLGLDSKRACEEALSLDFHVSEELVNSICRRLKHPKVCPCGERIFSGSKCKNDS